MTVFQDGINDGVGLFVADRLGVGFYGDTYGITLEIETLLRVIMAEILRVV